MRPFSRLCLERRTRSAKDKKLVKLYYIRTFQIPTLHNGVPSLAHQAAVLQVAVGWQVGEYELQYLIGKDIQIYSGQGRPAIVVLAVDLVSARVHPL